MKKILIRAGLSPLENLSASHMLKNNSIGNNVGNLIYAYSVFRALTKDDTELIPNHYKLDSKQVDQMNAEYDCFVIPLADAFRKEFMSELRKMTNVIKKLKMPCVVTGVGLRAPFEPGIGKSSFPFDEEVKDFMKAVLDKSSIVGVRGSITGDYLKNLGFREEIDYTVIGCPSMYTFGKDLSVKDTILTRDSLVSVNNSVMSTESVEQFLERSMEQLPNHYFLPQLQNEMRLMYTGMPYIHNQKVPSYPCTLDTRLYQEDRVKFFCNVPSWLSFLREADLSFGCRLHGNVASVLAGTPALFLPHDARMRELTDYHNFTHVWAKDIHEDTNIFDLVEKLDFKQVLNGHAQRFDHYVDFLNKNKLEHTYSEGSNLEPKPLEQKLAQMNLEGPVKSIVNCDLNEIVARFNDYFPSYDKTITSTKQRAVKAEKEAADAKKKLKTAEEALKKLQPEFDLQKNQADTPSLVKRIKNYTSRFKG